MREWSPRKVQELLQSHLVSEVYRLKPKARHWSSLLPAPNTCTLSGSEQYVYTYGSSLVAQTVKNLPAMQETWVRSLGWEEPLEEEMATHSISLPGESPQTEKPGRLQSMGLQRVRHDWVTKHSTPHTYLEWIHFAVQQKVTQHCKAAMLQ